MRSSYTALLVAGILLARVAAQTDAVKKGPGSHRPSAWIVSFSGITAMEQQKGGAEVVKRLLADPHTIVVAANPHSNLFNESQRAVSVLSFDDCKAAVDKRSNADVKTLFVDLEKWSGTPKTDQEHPEAATRRCHELAHQNGRDIAVIATPAMDLMAVLDPDFKGTQYASAIHYDLEGKLAVASDAVEIQVENIEDNPEQYERTLRTMVDQIRTARKQANLNPDVPIYAGLSTGVVAKRIPTDTLVAKLKEDVSRTRDLVTGYWMAIPAKTLCPGCGEPNPEVAVRLLESLKE